ncbi:hypothetical protein LXL04_006940 [Taraxacum kok-saghyz]
MLQGSQVKLCQLEFIVGYGDGRGRKVDMLEIRSLCCVFVGFITTFTIKDSVADRSLKAFSDGFATDLTVADTPDSSNVRQETMVFENQFLTCVKGLRLRQSHYEQYGEIIRIYI